MNRWEKEKIKKLLKIRKALLEMNNSANWNHAISGLLDQVDNQLARLGYNG